MNGATSPACQALGDGLLEPERVRVAARREARVGEQQLATAPAAVIAQNSK